MKVRPCDKKYGEKTYLGILLGELPLSISHSIDKNGIVMAEHAMYNPAIFIPEIKDIVFGCGSWWSKIDTEEELKQITNSDIENTWYVNFLKKIDTKE